MVMSFGRRTKLTVVGSQISLRSTVGWKEKLNCSKVVTQGKWATLNRASTPRCCRPFRVQGLGEKPLVSGVPS